MNPRPSPLSSRPLHDAAIAAGLLLTAPAVRAADSVAPEWQALLKLHLGWVLLAVLGLVALVLTVAGVRRQRRNERSLMEMTTQLRDDDLRLPEPIVHPRSAEAEALAIPEAAQLPPLESLDEALADASRTEPTFVLPPSNVHHLPTARANAAAPAAPPSPVATFPLPAGSPARTTDAPGIDPHLFLALHHVDLSIEVLHRHLLGESRPMPAVWLMLLDLARTHGREQTFRELALDFHQRFNARTPAWDGFPPDRDEPGLEAYPRLVKEITLTWGTHECRRLLDRLLYDNRGGDRRGFTLNAYNDLIALRRAIDSVLHTIDRDLAEEAKVRGAYAAVEAEASAAELPGTSRSPLVRDLESQLDEDLRASGEAASALEDEHPALAGMLAREWGNAALSSRLCEMLARGGDGAHALSQAASEDMELLRRMAERLVEANQLAVTLDDRPVTP